MSKFTKISSSPNEQSLNFIIPIVVLLLIGMLYVDDTKGQILILQILS